jgi:hypothetical protein
MSAMMRRSLRKEVLMKQQPTLFLTVGLPCTGKTTVARRIEIEQRALRLTKDEWVKALYGHENPPPGIAKVLGTAERGTYPEDELKRLHEAKDDPEAFARVAADLDLPFRITVAVWTWEVRSASSC